MPDLVSLGEMLLRLAPPAPGRLRRARTLDVHPCGAQFNIAANLAALGRHSVFLTRLPNNELGYLAHSLAESYGVDMSHVQFGSSPKMGLVFVEFGAAPRRHLHLYDRQGSAASTIATEDFAWADLMADARLAYADGIFPALNAGCRAATAAFVGAARKAGCTVCFDVNYRESLWSPEEALVTYRELLPHVDVLVTGRDVAERIFSYSGSDEDLLRAFHADFGCKVVCLTYREMQGVLRGSWRSLALHAGRVVHGRPVEFDVVDRFGTGDAFFAGFLHIYLDSNDVQHALDFGNALCALAHTVEGDVATFSPQEVADLLNEDRNLTTRR